MVIPMSPFHLCLSLFVRQYFCYRHAERPSSSCLRKALLKPRRPKAPETSLWDFLLGDFEKKGGRVERRLFLNTWFSLGNRAGRLFDRWTSSLVCTMGPCLLLKTARNNLNANGMTLSRLANQIWSFYEESWSCLCVTALVRSVWRTVVVSLQNSMLVFIRLEKDSQILTLVAYQEKYKHYKKT